MTEFRLTSADIKQMNNLIALTSRFDHDKSSDGVVLLVVSAEENKLYILENGKQSMTDCSVSVSDIKVDPLIKGNPYTCININKFKTALAKCSSSGLTLKINHTGKSTLFVPDNGSTFTLFCYDTITEAEAEERLNYWKSSLEKDSFKNKKTIILNSEVMKASEVAGKFISKSLESSANAYDTLSLLFEDQKIKYADRFVVLEKTISSTFTGSFYIPKNILDFTQSIVKFTELDIDLNFSDDDTYAFFEMPTIGLRTVIGMPDVSFVYPSDTELAGVMPDPNSCVKVKTTVKELVRALDQFEGIFNLTDYFWKQVRLFNSEDLLAKENIRLQYDDYTADVDTFFSAQLISNTDSNSDFNFLVPGSIIDILLDLMTGDSVELTYSSAPPSVNNGKSIVLESEGVKALCLKLTD